MNNNRRQSVHGQQQLTFPTLPVKDLVELLRNGLGLNVTGQDLINPKSDVVARVYSALVELVGEMPREQVGQAIQMQLENVS